MNKDVLLVIVGGVIGLGGSILTTWLTNLFAGRREEKKLRLTWRKEYRMKRLMPMREQLDQVVSGPVQYINVFHEQTGLQADEDIPSAEEFYGKETVSKWLDLLDHTQTMHAAAALDPLVAQLVREIRLMLYDALARGELAQDRGIRGMRYPPTWKKFITKLSELDKAIELAIAET